MEESLIILKPDSVQRGLIGDIISRIERRGLRIAALKMIWLDRELAERHYHEHKGKHFYEPLLKFITSAPVVVMLVHGPEAIAVLRAMMGATDSKQAAPGTIRGDYGLSNRHNLLHGSDSLQSAQREVALFFTPEEIHAYQRVVEPWADPDAEW
ncbi:MAG TPA: nucleoside-diphosphate kinase [Thermoflexia bacterium]|nr:nucleoside-diphosphate kinase [Thermoflexia bacterium]